MEELRLIQQELVIGKNQLNAHAGFNYRSCEDILEALKPHLKMHECFLTISDELVLLGDRIYIKAEVTLTNKDGKTFKSHAFAREQELKTGMDQAMITGAASSYSRKYALNGMFLIDDAKDPDAQPEEKAPAEATATRKKYPEGRLWLNEGGDDWDSVLNFIFDDDNPTMERLLMRFKISKATQVKIADMILKKGIVNN